MSMLVPLGVLALGAVFAGMIWFKPFFGDHKYVADFYDIPLAEMAEADAGHAEGGDEGHATTATDEGHATTATDEGHATTATDEGHATTATDDGHAAATTDDGHAADAGHGDEHHASFGGAPGEGGLYFGPENTVLADAHAAPNWVKVSPFIAMLAGFIMAMWFYIWNPTLPGRLAANQQPLYQFLKNKWYFDEIYDVIFVAPAKAIGRFLWKRGDGNVIDGTLNGVAMGIIPFFTRLAGRMQSGYIFTYAFAMVIGIAVLVTWMTMTGGAN
jgi:NADH-quinone oxidoreductase subunit L